MDINKVRQFFGVIMSYDDILDGMTKALSYKANVTA
jgi:hypothetical protein